MVAVSPAAVAARLEEAAARRAFLSVAREQRPAQALQFLAAALVPAESIAMVRPPINARLVELKPPPPSPPGPMTMLVANCVTGPSRALTVAAGLPVLAFTIATAGGVVLVAETGVNTAYVDVPAAATAE